MAKFIIEFRKGHEAWQLLTEEEDYGNAEEAKLAYSEEYPDHEFRLREQSN